ncbi:MAG: histidinol dehydrogenase [Deltaproteobacteria bacterium]|jgi:histidinol dehydrogenase|nr:histidinol dehydrogenase [Deltaproteobacteria bacterium]
MIKVEQLSSLSSPRRQAILKRSSDNLRENMDRTIEILAALKKDPEKELAREYGPAMKKAGGKFDLKRFLVSEAEFEQAVGQINSSLIDALGLAYFNIYAFHKAQLGEAISSAEFSEGLLAGRFVRPISKAGVYVPGGRASYPSSALMNIVPAKAAGVKTIVVATPPGEDFCARPEILVACRIANATQIFKLGGAWAIGCLAYGLGGLPKVDKIVGPGSSWVTAAKLAVFGEVDIDQPAGPSEGFIIADDSADPTHLTWDFLSQLEHDPQAAAVLVTTSEKLAKEVARMVNQEVPQADRADIIEKSLANAAILTTPSLQEAFDFANEYAPEHLQVVVKRPMAHLGKIENAGSVFLGPWSPIPAGDYASGTNHVLPTGGSARAFSGLSTDSFLKKTTFQQLTKKALKDISWTITTLAQAEGLPAHAKTATVRLAEKPKKK